jgi:outer membrane biosynthesis protein TonB
MAHVSVLGVILVLAEVHPFSTVTAEPISVELVPPEDAPPPPKLEVPAEKPIEIPPPKTSDSFELQAQSAPAPAPAAAAPPPAAAPQPQPKTEPQQQAAKPPQKPQPSQPPAPPPPVAATPAPPPMLPPAVPQEPDITVKYAVMLGLPAGGDFDSAAYKSADIAQDDTAALRRRLKSCAKLPAAVAPTDKVTIKLRVSLAPDGTLTREPILIEASASAKGPLLMQSAMAALTACQPYSMLPRDKYDEWKVLDLSFTPQDLVGG